MIDSVPTRFDPSNRNQPTMAGLKIGDPVGDLHFLRADGSPVRLSEFATPLLLVFMRHLRCISCLGHLAAIRARLEEFEQAGLRVLVITQSKPTALGGVSLPLPTVCDPDRVAYRHFGLDRGRVSMFFRWRVLARYFKMIGAGFMPKPGETGEDMLQLGGDFIIAADRTLAYAHRSNDPSDRPPIDELLGVARSLAGNGGVRVSE